MLSIRGRRLQITLIAGLLLVFSELRDFWAPGFLRINAGFEIDAIDKLLSGILFMALGLLHRMRSRHIQTSKNW
jgi:hypothetical protein